MNQARASEGVPLDERSPDSGDLRVSQNTQHESGIPPARERLARNAEGYQALEQLELVLVETTRAEANVGLMLRSLKHLVAGASAAREANALLMQELEALRIRVARVFESESVLKQRVAALENALHAAGRERESWLAQEDAFLAGLLDEHEQELASLTRAHDQRLAELDYELDELRQQRDLARTEALRLSYERDAAVALLNEPVASTEPSPTPPAPASAGRLPLGSVKLPKPVLTTKPDVSSRPLVGYSMVGGEEAGERLGLESPASRRPRS